MNEFMEPEEKLNVMAEAISLSAKDIDKNGCDKTKLFFLMGQLVQIKEVVLELEMKHGYVPCSERYREPLKYTIICGSCKKSHEIGGACLP